MAVTLTVNFNLPKPDPEANVDEEFVRLQTTLDAIDAVMKTIADDAASRAAGTHAHEISEITGLSTALAGKMPASQTFKLDDLTDVAGADAAANGYVLVKTSTGWLPSSPAAAIGEHEHGITDVIGLPEALVSKADQDDVDALSSAMQARGVPVGTIIYFATSTAPDGYLECNGAVITSLYPDLRALLVAAGSPFGTSGSDPKLPDLRGEFMRGWDHGRGIDAARVFGSSQLDAMQGHKHQWGNGGTGNGQSLPVSSSDTGYNFPWGNNSGGSDYNRANGPSADGVNGTPRTAAETRPRNIAMLPCIKAFGAVTVEGMADLAALLAAIATQAQAEAGADNTKLMTPLRTRQAVAAYNKFEFISAHVVASGGGGVVIQNLQDFETLIVDGFFVFSANGQLAYQVSSNNGAGWIAGTNDYTGAYWGQVSGSAGSGSLSGTQGTFAPSTVLAGEDLEIWAKLARFNKTRRILGFSLSSNVNSSSLGSGYVQSLFGSTATAVVLNSLRFFPTTGTMGYDFKLHGIRG